MFKKILLILLTVVAFLVAAGALYYRFFIYRPPAIPADDRAAVTLMPLPAKLRLGRSEFRIKSGIRVVYKGHREARLERAVDRFVGRLSTRSGGSIAVSDAGPKLVIECKQKAGEFPQPGEDESYTLRIRRRDILLRASSPYGVLHGLEALQQLARIKEGKVAFPVARIEDAPRYPWRGLMIDVCRHWVPKEVLLRNLDAMAAARLNVLHLHLTESQAFRIESKVFPKLHELGSKGAYYSQDDIRELVVYAADRGIRIVPEFDVPGHSESWLVGYPELGSAPGPYRLQDRGGIFHPVMDPTREEVYIFLDRFFAEMTELFPDPYVHIGGDEVDPHDWNNNPAIQAFMKEKGFDGPHGLQAYFNSRMHKLFAARGKKMVGWEEILSPDLADEVLVQSWKNQKSLFQAVQAGGSGILSAGLYLDHKRSAAEHYKVDPEVMPGAVDIEPDSSNWQTWDLTATAMGSTIQLQMVLFGAGEKRRGFFGMLGSYTGFPEATLRDSNLDLPLNTDVGKLHFSATISGDSLNGEMSMGVLKFPATGHRTGGNDLPGTSFPKFERIRPLNDPEKERILGGEGCMWLEMVDSRTLDSRIWPRQAVIAEKLWSPATLTTDIPDMYRRLDVFDRYLEEIGMQHQSYRKPILQALAGGRDSDALARLVDVLEEVKFFDRMVIYDSILTMSTPLDRLVDAAAPESREARLFSEQVDAFVDASSIKDPEGKLRRQLEDWRKLHNALQPLGETSEKMADALLVAFHLSGAAEAGIEALDALEGEKKASATQQEAWRTTLDEAAQAHAGVLIATVPAIRKLVEAVQMAD